MSVAGLPCECQSCGLFQQVPPLPPGEVAVCARCGVVLRRGRSDSFRRTFALLTAAAVLMGVLCATPLMSVETAGITLHAGLFSGPEELTRRGMPELAAVVVFTTLVAPVARIAATAYVLLRLRGQRRPAHLRRLFVWIERLAPWSMIEVFVFGVFVAYVKLADLVRITLDTGVFALLALTIVLIWADSALDHDAVWDALDPRDPPSVAASRMLLSREAPAALVSCESCRLVQERRAAPVCACCGAKLHLRKPDSVARTWALVIAAAVLYVPANLYPVLTVVQLGAGTPSTILGGVRELLESHMYPLAALVFFASVAVPMLKLVGLAGMLLATQLGQGAWLRDRTRLYLFVRWIGRWSMIDIFMEALLGALVRFGNVVTIEPGVGALAFAGVVILTMFAAECFDPRLMWDAARPAMAASGVPQVAR